MSSVLSLRGGSVGEMRRGENAGFGLNAGLADRSVSSSLSEKRKRLLGGRRSRHWNSAAEKRRLAYDSRETGRRTGHDDSFRSRLSSMKCCVSADAWWKSS